MSIHSEHPFATGGPDRNPLRRLRGRLPSPVSVWTAGSGRARVGWTLSSFLVADGVLESTLRGDEPAQVIGVLDEDSALADLLTSTSAASLVVNLLGWSHRALADAFAGVAPAPGGAFRLGRWHDSSWGPVLSDAPAWLGARVEGPLEHAGWGLLVRAVVEQVEIGTAADDGMLTHLGGRYRPVGAVAPTDRGLG